MNFEAMLVDTVKQAVREVLAEQRPTPVPLAAGPTTLTVKEAAALVGVSAPTMYDLIHREDFDACIQVGRKKVILRHKLLAWMERCAGSGVGN